MLNKNDPLIGAVQEVMKRNHVEREAARLVNEKFGVTDRKALPHEKQGAWDAAYKTVLNEGVEALDELAPANKKNVKDVENRAFNKMRAAMDDRNPKSFEKAHNVEKMAKRKMKKLDEKELVGNQPKLDVASSSGEKKPDGKLTSHDFKHLRTMKEDDTTSPSSMGIKKPDYAPAGTTPDYAKPTTQTVNRAAKTSMPAGTVKEENLEEKAVSKAQHRFFGLVRAIQKGKAKGSPEAEKAAKTMPVKSVRDYAKTSEKGLPEKKKMKIDEGFNNRHGLSVTASAEKQVVAGQLNEDDIDSYENRMTAGLGGFTPYGGGHFGGGTAKKSTSYMQRKVRVDTPNINTRTGEKLPAKPTSGVPSIAKGSGPRGRTPAKGPWNRKPQSKNNSQINSTEKPAWWPKDAAADKLSSASSEKFNRTLDSKMGQTSTSTNIAKDPLSKKVPQYKNEIHKALDRAEKTRAKKQSVSKPDRPAKDFNTGGRRDQALKAAQARNSNPTARPAVDIKSGDLRSQILNKAQQGAKARTGNNPTASATARPASDIKAGDLRTKFLNKAQQARTGSNPTATPVSKPLDNKPVSRSLSPAVKNAGVAGVIGGAALAAAAYKAGNNSVPSSSQAASTEKVAKDQSRVSQGLSPAAQQRGAEQDKVGTQRTTSAAPKTAVPIPKAKPAKPAVAPAPAPAQQAKPVQSSMTPAQRAQINRAIERNPIASTGKSLQPLGLGVKSGTTVQQQAAPKANRPVGTGREK